MKYVLFIGFLVFATFTANGQRFSLGESLAPGTGQFTLLGISSSTNVASYRYEGTISGSMFGRKIGDIIVGIKGGKVVTVVYDLIPLFDDVGVPQSIIDAVQKTLAYPLAYRNGVYGVNIDNETISLSRSNNTLTFNKDRIMYFKSIKSSILRN